MLINLLLGGTSLLFFGMSVAARYHVRWVRRLPTSTELGLPQPITSDTQLRTCSIVIAARDEAARIEETVRRLLALTGAELEVIVVNDRSVDATEAILQRMALQEQRVKVLRVDTLPAGWLGKCHACYQGAKIASGEWLLFTDADCWLKADWWPGRCALSIASKRTISR